MFEILFVFTLVAEMCQTKQQWTSGSSVVSKLKTLIFSMDFCTAERVVYKFKLQKKKLSATGTIF